MTDLLIGLGLEPVVFGPWVSALGWALVHFVWQGALIGGVFAGGRWLLRDGQPHHRYWLGLGCMATMAAIPLATFVFLLQSSATLSGGFALPGNSGSLFSWSDPNVVALAASSGFSTSSLAVSLEQMLPWIVGLWGFGVLVMSTRVGIHWVRMLRLSTIGTRHISQELWSRVQGLQQAMGVQRAVRVVETTVAQVPTVLGWLRPVILLPTSTLLGLSPAQLDLVIAHELGHIRRYDYLINLLQIVVETLLFYHPMVRWISHCVRDERETCCDDLVVATCGNRIQYAKALANLETMRGSDLQPALAATGGQLVQRIERIVCTHRQRETSSVNSGVMVLIIGCLVMVAQFADPMGVFEERRSRLADSLAADLLAERDLGQEDYLPLSEARVVAADNPPIRIGDFSADSWASEANPVILGPNRPAAGSRAPAPLFDSLALEVATKTAPSPPQTLELLATRPLDSRPQPLLSVPKAAAPAVQLNPTPLVSYDNAVRPPALTARVEPAAPRWSEQERARDEFLAQPPAAGPVAIRKISPDYPVRARISGQQGYVQLEFSLTADGRVNDVRVVDSWPRRVFERSAKRAIKGWRFDPATVTGGERINQRFDFALSGQNLDLDFRDGCLPLTGTRICRHDSPTALMAEAANLN